MEGVWDIGVVGYDVVDHVMTRPRVIIVRRAYVRSIG